MIDFADLSGASPEQEVAFYTAAHNAGAVEWDEAERMHRETRADWRRQFIDILRPKWQLDAIAAHMERTSS